MSSPDLCQWALNALFECYSVPAVVVDALVVDALVVAAADVAAVVVAAGVVVVGEIDAADELYPVPSSSSAKVALLMNLLMLFSEAICFALMSVRMLRAHWPLCQGEMDDGQG